MNGDKRNGDTFEFRPVQEEKKRVERRENDEYSTARKNYVSNKKNEKDGNGLVILAVILAVILIITIVAGIFIIKPFGNPAEENPSENPEINITEEEIEEEEEEEEKEITVSCSIVFYSDSVIKKNDGYTILADLYDEGFYKFDNRKLIINSKTDIRESGKRLSPDALVYLIESMAGESIVFDGEIMEEDGTVLSITFDSSVLEESEEPTEENTQTDETVENSETTENGETESSFIENNENSEGAVITE